ncbi:hypothetical protein, partial [uncultured Gammaproteobacteria bacterium]
ENKQNYYCHRFFTSYFYCSRGKESKQSCSCCSC